MTFEWPWIVLGAVTVVALVLAILARARLAAAVAQARSEREGEVAVLGAERRSLEERLDEANDRRHELEAELERLRQQHAALQAASAGHAAEARTRIAAQAAQIDERGALLEVARQQLGDAFQNLAHRIFDDRTRSLDEQQQRQLGALLDPLKEQLREFRQTVSDTWARESRERGMLAREIDLLKTLNQRISDDAQSLTQALRGDTRAQGAWGELVLERVLEASGLTRGREFEVQGVYRGDDGSRRRPDVIVRLPDGRDVVIDAKVSLVAYERYCSAPGEAERIEQLGEHVASLRRHIIELSGRSYTQIEGVRTLDFVLLFIPIEGAFVEAVRHDASLYDHALSRNIVVVSPSTLLATLRTVAHLWQLERRNENATVIAKKAGLLYDSFVTLVEDVRAIGEALERARGSYDAVVHRLVTQRGSLVRRAEELRQLGASTTKTLPDAQRAAAGPGEAGAGDAEPDARERDP